MRESSSFNKLEYNTVKSFLRKRRQSCKGSKTQNLLFSHKLRAHFGSPLRRFACRPELPVTRYLPSPPLLIHPSFSLVSSLNLPLHPISFIHRQNGEMFNTTTCNLCGIGYSLRILSLDHQHGHDPSGSF